MPGLGREGGLVKFGKSLRVPAMLTRASLGPFWLGWFTRWGHNTWWIKTEAQAFLPELHPLALWDWVLKVSREEIMSPHPAEAILTEQLNPIQHPSSWGHALFPVLCQALRPARTKQKRAKAGTRWIIKKQWRTVYNQVEYIHPP